MIEVILDFDELAIQENDESYEVEYQLKRYIYEKLRIIGWEELPKQSPNKRGIVFEALRDNLHTLTIPEIGEDYIFDMNDEWGWLSYEEYLWHKKQDAQYGLKNEKGVRDDLLLIFVNFRAFYLAKIGTAIIFLEAIFEALNVSTDEENANRLDMQILIKS